VITLEEIAEILSDNGVSHDDWNFVIGGIPLYEVHKAIGDYLLKYDEREQREMELDFHKIAEILYNAGITSEDWNFIISPWKSQSWNFLKFIEEDIVDMEKVGEKKECPF